MGRKKAEKETKLKHHQDQIIRTKNKIKAINWEHDGLKEEMKTIPEGASNRWEIRNKIDQRREAEASTSRQKLAAYLFQNHNKEVSHALWQNVLIHAPIKQEKMKGEIDKLKSESAHTNPTDAHLYEVRDYDLKKLKFACQRKINKHEQALEKLQKPTEKKRSWKWNPFQGMSKKD